MIIIIPIEYRDIPAWLINAAETDGILFSRCCSYYAALLDNEIIGLCAILFLVRAAWLKCNFVLPTYRGRGYGFKMICWRLRECAARGITRVFAHCTPMAVNIHLRAGAKMVGRFKNGIIKVKYESLSQSDSL